MTLKDAYDTIEIKYKNIMELEPFQIIKSVDEHRNFWKPTKVKTILLAESHVHTNETEHAHTIEYDNFSELKKCPRNFVKLVYCLGYGEKRFTEIKKNSGTPQFWKIFVACTYKNFNSEFNKILVSKTPNFDDRIQNKIKILEKLKENGIWLLDASIVALYNNNKKPSQKIMKEIIEISWKKYVSEIINETKPGNIIVIGKGVSKILKDKLTCLNIRFNDQPQPQARLSKKEIENTYLKYYELCNGNDL